MKKDFIIRDNGGTRSGKERRQNNLGYIKLDRRTGKDRRSGDDRRDVSIQHNGIERRDIHREKGQCNI